MMPQSMLFTVKLFRSNGFRMLNLRQILYSLSSEFKTTEHCEHCVWEIHHPGTAVTTTTFFITMEAIGPKGQVGSPTQTG